MDHVHWVWDVSMVSVYPSIGSTTRCGQTKLILISVKLSIARGIYGPCSVVIYITHETFMIGVQLSCVHVTFILTNVQLHCMHSTSMSMSSWHVCVVWRLDKKYVLFRVCTQHKWITTDVANSAGFFFFLFLALTPCSPTNSLIHEATNQPTNHPANCSCFTRHLPEETIHTIADWQWHGARIISGLKTNFNQSLNCTEALMFYSYTCIN